jgi:hypothetical protein
MAELGHNRENIFQGYALLPYRFGCVQAKDFPGCFNPLRV